MDLALITCDLGYGDAGKGTVTDHLVRAFGADQVVRFNGGAQAAHNVITPDGRHHTFQQFGSGTFVDGVRTHLSRFMFVNPLALFVEDAQLQRVGVDDALARLTIDPRAPITTPFHVAANRLRELARGAGRHGSCGMGIGETMMDVLAGGELRAGDLHDRGALRHRLAAIQQRKRDEMQAAITDLPGAREHARALLDPQAIEDTFEIFDVLARVVEMVDDFPYEGVTVFEAAQGVLLDQDAGFHPYTTWSQTTPANARDLLSGFNGHIHTIGIARSYMTRHGAGPLVSEDPQLAAHTPEAHNRHGAWQGTWRVGHADLVALRYAAQAAGGLDALAVTHMDYVRDGWQVAVAYRNRDGVRVDSLALPDSRDAQQTLTDRLDGLAPILERCDADELLAGYEQAAAAPIELLSYGPTSDSKRSALTAAV